MGTANDVPGFLGGRAHLSKLGDALKKNKAYFLLVWADILFYFLGV